MTKDKLEEIIAYLTGEFAKIRVGRASIELFEDIEVEAYDTKLPIKQLATLSAPEPRVIIVQPWDKSVLKNVERALRSKMSDVAPIIDGDVIRITFEPPTEERRRELAKQVGGLVEEAKVKIRQTREDEIQELRRLEDKKEISEDEFFKRKEELQETVDEYNKKITEMGDKKEQEIMQV